jgi:hypothetical protein
MPAPELHGVHTRREEAIRTIAPMTAAAAATRAARGHPVVTGAFLQWLPIAAAVVVLAGLVYATVQQSLRSGADDPQLQMAGDLAAQLSAGAEPAALVGSGRVELATSLSPFATVFDTNGTVLASTARLDGRAEPPVPPAGVLRAAQTHGRNSLSWQPRPGVRAAIVVQRWQAADGQGAGTVLVGRSLKEVERREQLTLLASAGGMGVALAGTAAACLAAAWVRRRLDLDVDPIY